MRRWFSPHTSSLLLRVASAAWGFAVAIALLPHWTRPAQPGQLPGFATSISARNTVSAVGIRITSRRVKRASKRRRAKHAATPIAVGTIVQVTF